jgi:hypothetical protein
MQLHLKKLKIAGGDETLRFTTELYLDRTKIAIVSNGGTGGGHQYDFFGSENRQIFFEWIEEFKTAAVALSNPLHQKLSEWVRDLQATIPTFAEQDIDADMVIDCAIDLHLLRKHCKTKTLFHLPEDPKGQYRTIAKLFTPRLESWIVNKYGTNVVIINKMFV